MSDAVAAAVRTRDQVELVAFDGAAHTHEAGPLIPPTGFA
jgi:hypothetical protein